MFPRDRYHFPKTIRKRYRCPDDINPRYWLFVLDTQSAVEWTHNGDFMEWISRMLHECGTTHSDIVFDGHILSHAKWDEYLISRVNMPMQADVERAIGYFKSMRLDIDLEEQT